MEEVRTKCRSREAEVVWQLLVALLFLCSTGWLRAEVELPKFESKYYIIYTDLNDDGRREAEIRMTRMADEYYMRTSDFSGAINRKLPFYLYSKKEDYVASGGPEVSNGFFDGEKLVAVAEDMSTNTWRTVQHEGFHQFAHFMIRGKLPTWVDEGLADYFAEGLFTGDEFYIGLIPHGRMVRVQEALAAQKFKPLNEMMHLTLVDWNAELKIQNYDQGWSMVQFLANGEKGKYQKQFARFMGDLGQGELWQTAWNNQFGGVQGFEKVWSDYWRKLPRNPTVELYAQANVSTFTSFLARAFSQQQKFASFDDFLKAGVERRLKSNPLDWLPNTLLDHAIEQQKALKANKCEYEIQKRALDSLPQIICTLPDGRRVIGTFTIRAGRVASVKTTLLPKLR